MMLLMTNFPFLIVLCSIEKQVREVMHKAFWDALEAKLNEDPPDFSHALVLIEEVKEVIAYALFCSALWSPRLKIQWNLSRLP